MSANPFESSKTQAHAAAGPVDIAIGLLLFTLVILLAVAPWIMMREIKRQEETMPRAYRAWVRLNGNKSGLNYGEWKALVETTGGRSLTFGN